MKTRKPYALYRNPPDCQSLGRRGKSTATLAQAMAAAGYPDPARWYDDPEDPGYIACWIHPQPVITGPDAGPQLLAMQAAEKAAEAS